MGKLNERMLIFYSQDRLPEKYISYAYSRNNPLRYKAPLGTKTVYIPEEIYYASYKKVIEWLMTTRLYKEYSFIRKIVWYLWRAYWKLTIVWGS